MKNSKLSKKNSGLPAEEAEQKKKVIQKNRNRTRFRRKIVLSRLMMIQQR
jgi:hypothetical protein